ncbi:MAG TPA: c-type cytochrome, partial [Cyclobacteriaceae bacterium]|nr:c-type cytochrome [Cyclobacteriaceae bacterium]
HSLVLTPDKKSILVVAGNHTDVPKMDVYKTLPVWKEDNLLPLITDPRGHAARRMAPGGWIAQMDSEGKNWTMISEGFRNQFDVAFNEAGDLFAYDSDMEWDFGLPWYRPTRLVHVTDASEFGWRTGTGPWNPAFPDNLPPVVNFGPGSPTNLVSLKDANFPDQYKKNTVLSFDWTYGIMYAIHLEAQGSTYTSRTEEFVSGTPLSLTDGSIGPDGNLYFLAGGRRLESDLYRLSYPGSNNAKVATIEPNAANKIRRSIEAYHEKKAGAVAFAWPYLKNEDRFIRFAARVAVEHQPISEWKELAFKEKDPVALVQTTMALAHQGDSTLSDKTLQAVMAVNFKALPENQKLDLLRAIELVVLRLKVQNPATKTKLIAYLDSNYPAQSNALNRGLARILIPLDAPGATAKTMKIMMTAKDEPLEQGASMYSDLIMRNPQYGNSVARMLANTPPRQQIYLALVLTQSKSGWTPELQQQYFSWFTKAYTFQGGNSYIGYISRMRENALKNVAPDKVAYFDELSGGNLVVKTTTTGGRGGRGQQGGNDLISTIPQPVGPGKNYTMELVQPWVSDELSARNFENGKKMFDAALCSTCHQIQGKGSNIGPDLTALGTRFSQKDILDNIINPSKVISDQYGTSIILLKSGTSVLGRVVNEDAKNVYISQNPFAPEQLRTVAKDQIVSTKVSETSSMLPGTINRLNEDELKDLLAYLISGGNKDHKAFLPK